VSLSIKLKESDAHLTIDACAAAAMLLPPIAAAAHLQRCGRARTAPAPSRRRRSASRQLESAQEVARQESSSAAAAAHAPAQCVRTFRTVGENMLAAQAIPREGAAHDFAVHLLVAESAVSERPSAQIIKAALERYNTAYASQLTAATRSDATATTHLPGPTSNAHMLSLWEHLQRQHRNMQAVQRLDEQTAAATAVAAAAQVPTAGKCFPLHHDHKLYMNRCVD
jgi:hypothetical protein